MIICLLQGVAIGQNLGKSNVGKSDLQESYVHPFVSVDGIYDDNIFNRQNESGDYFTVVSPGLWIAAPASRKKMLVDFYTANVTPGGMPVGMDLPKAVNTYQAYALYQGSWQYYDTYNSEDREDHRAEAFLQYNPGGGFSLNVTEEYKKAYDPRATGDSTTLDKYETNLAKGMLFHETSKKLSFRFDYTNFYVNYFSPGNLARDRSDDSYSVFLYYKLKPKVSLATQYEYIDIDYDNDMLSDSKEHQISEILIWDRDPKSLGKMKMGYVYKEFSFGSIKNRSDFIFEYVEDYCLTENSCFKILVLRKLHETNIVSTEYILAHNLSVIYSHRFADTFSASLELTSSRDGYKGDITIGPETKERDDDVTIVSPVLTYRINKWIHVDITYKYTERDSNFDIYDYEENTAIVRLSATL